MEKMETTAGSAVPTTEISTVSEVELEATAAVKDGSKSSSGAYIAQRRGKKYGRVKSCLLKRSCFVYTLIILGCACNTNHHIFINKLQG